MGAEESHIPLQPVAQKFGYLAVIFRMPDKIQVVHGSDAEYSVIQHVITNTWKEGIQSTTTKCAGSVLSFKLKGLPFETGFVSMNIREVVCQILQHLHNIGRRLLIATNLTESRERFSFIFVRKKTERISQELAFVAMSSTDKLFFWNLDQHARDKISQAIHSQYRVDFEDTTDGGKNYEVILNGSPWSSTTSNHAEARAILIKMFSVMMERYGFMCAMNVKRTEDAFVFVPKSNHSNTVTEFFIISLRKTSKIQVFKAPDYLIPIIHRVLVDAFGKTSHDIVKTIDHRSGKVEFKYKSHTVQKQSVQCVMTKLIVCKLLEVLKGQGWGITTGFDMSRGLTNKSELLFQKCPSHSDCKVFCLSPDFTSKLCVINAPPRITSACRKVISCRWPVPLISETQYESPATSVEFELGGKPWSDSGDCAYFAHSMLCHLLEEFFHKGFKIKLTADVIPECMQYGEGTSSSHDPNAWWFMHKPPIVPELCTSEEAVPPLAQLLSEDFYQIPVPDVHVKPSESQMPSEPKMPTESQLYGEPPPSYETVMWEQDRD